MDVFEKFQLAISAGDALDWPQLCRELDAEHATAQTADARERLLALFCTMMDMVERIEISPAALNTFRIGRTNHYQRLLLREAGPAGRPSEKALLDIMVREVLSGRMTPNDALRLKSRAGIGQPARPEKSIAAAPMPNRQVPDQSGRWTTLGNGLVKWLGRPLAFPRKAPY